MGMLSNPHAGAAARHAPVWAGMAAVAVISWTILAQTEGGMSMMGPVDPAPLAPVFAMWAVMMLAMMLPAILPSALMFAGLSARRDPAHGQRATALYVAGYAASWVGFALPAALAQWALTASGLLDPMARSSNALLSAAILLAAGAYQFSGLKTACLSTCRSPLAYFMQHWRDGARGAALLGLRHGSYCVACCWALMAVMFVVGAMSLVWMGLLSLLVLGEKVVPTAWRFDRIMGVALLGAGLWVAAGA